MCGRGRTWAPPAGAVRRCLQPPGGGRTPGRCPGAGRGGTMAGKFVLTKGSTGKYHFNLVASNGQVIATSETYERKQSALNGIESVKNNAPGAEIDDQTED